MTSMTLELTTGAAPAPQPASADCRDLYRMSVDGGELRRLTQNPEGNFEPAVSPDGTEGTEFCSSVPSV